MVRPLGEEKCSFNLKLIPLESLCVAITANFLLRGGTKLYLLIQQGYLSPPYYEVIQYMNSVLYHDNIRANQNAS